MIKKGMIEMKRFKKLWISLSIVFGVIVIGISGGIIYANYVLDSTLDKMNVTEAIEREEANITEQVITKEEETNVINIAVFGLDQEDDGLGTRSDAMKILSLDLNENLAKIGSIQRDTLIYIPKEIQDFDKLNHAYAYGGAKLALQTLNYNFDLDLTRYVAFNFNAVEQMVDAVGGVEVNVEDFEVEYSDGQLKESGVQTLTGAQALSYMRIRKADSDYVRMERQTTVMKGIFSKLKECSYPQLIDLLNQMIPFIETNLSKSEIINLGLQALTINLTNIEQYQIPLRGHQEINQSVSYKGFEPLYIMNSYEQLVKDLHNTIYGNESYQPSDIILKNQDLIYQYFGYHQP